MIEGRFVSGSDALMTNQGGDQEAQTGGTRRTDVRAGDVLTVFPPER